MNEVLSANVEKDFEKRTPHGFTGEGDDTRGQLSLFGLWDREIGHHDPWASSGLR